MSLLLKHHHFNRIIQKNNLISRWITSSAKEEINRPAVVKIYEVGPRDGLQNEPKILSPSVKIDFINRLTKTGLTAIETTSFVSPAWIPQLADNTEVYEKIEKKEGVIYPVLIPNLKGFENALKVGVKDIAIFVAASETFSQKNTNCSIEESFQRFEPVVKAAKALKIPVRGYISTIYGCPYEGKIKPTVVAKCTERLLDMGCYEVSLGDTIGTATPGSLSVILKEVLSIAHPTKLAIHCHDTYGMALANIVTSLDFGISIVDSAVSGFGGCPYALGATGNVATEDVVYMLHGMGVETGIDLDELIKVGEFICHAAERKTDSKVTRALGKSKLKF